MVRNIHKALNLAVKRNIKRFPDDFMFQLTKEEWEDLRFQFETSKGSGGARYLPYAFTEHGVAMLSGILTSDKAISTNIAIMRAFVAIRRLLIKKSNTDLLINEIKDRLNEHDCQLNSIYNALENLPDKEADAAAEKAKWVERERIGFKQ